VRIRILVITFIVRSPFRFIGFAGLALFLATAAGMRGQGTGDSPAVQADKVVVEGSQDEKEAFGATRAEIDGAEPVLTQSWHEISAQVPNFQVESAGSNSFGAIFTLRGLANTPYFSEPAVTVYFDDIPLGGSFTYPTDLIGFGSATVLRGPQPTGFGRAGDGGVVVFLPTAAQSKDAGEIRLGLGDYDARSLTMEDGGPQNATADFDVAAAYVRRDGYIENTQIGQRVDDERAMSAFARERFHPSSTSEVSVEILTARHRDGAAPLVPLGGPFYTVERSQEGETDTDTFGAALKGVVNMDAARFTTVTSYTHWKLNPYDDWLVLPPPIDSNLTQSQEAVNEELRLASTCGGEFSWDMGAWLSGGTTTGAAQRSIGGVFPIEASDFGYSRREAAVFGELVFVPAPTWKITIGVRTQATEKDYHQDEELPSPNPHLHFTRSDDAFLPKVVASHDLGTQTAAYASISSGTRPGGYAAYTDNPALIPYSAEHTTAFEAGLGTSLAENSVKLTARAFDYEIRNYQIERSFSSTDYFVATAPRARSVGGELEGTWTPMTHWTVALNLGVTHATLVEFHDPLTGASHEGDRAPYAPSYTAALSISYRPSLGWFASASIASTGRTFYTESENPVYAQNAYAVASGRIGYESARWRVSLYIENAANEGYYTLIVPGVNSAAPGDPRNFGSELALKF
jgi:iron complex outermembrane recepter protein